ncbi:MAG: hypothetical protein HS101_05020 [Planctomycetia bacterium]|nr:hypothetical protein [Planctomycetia bacterium]MCC7314316.1 hypothetical protein [Planctomycetota bacterium]
MTPRSVCFAVALWACIIAAPVQAADPTTQPTSTTALPKGFKPHVTSVPGGKVDWASGHLLVEGIGKARGTDEQQQQMAERAATVVAARNALALAAGIQINRYGRFSDVRDGTVQIEGLLKGHLAVDVNWDPAAKPPSCTITLSVPLWGIKGLSATVFEEERQRARSSAHMPIAGSQGTKASDDEYLLIDCRGTHIEPCLFPIIINSDGRVLYDASVRRQYHGGILQTVRYVELDDQTASGATSRPALDTGDHLHVFKSQALKRSSKTDIVLGRGDVLRIADDARLSELLRDGQVLVLLDPAAAAQAISPTR